MMTTGLMLLCAGAIGLLRAIDIAFGDESDR